MSLAEKIIEKVKSLPDDKQSEILDFIDSLSKKVKEEKKEWNKFSLESAKGDFGLSYAGEVF